MHHQAAKDGQRQIWRCELGPTAKRQFDYWACINSGDNLSSQLPPVVFIIGIFTYKNNHDPAFPGFLIKKCKGFLLLKEVEG